MTQLVIGASGFLGSHVTRELVEQGADVRVLVRATSSLQGIEGLAVERRVGDIADLQSVREAMTGCDVVHYCVVDARPWLRDSAALFRTNVEALRGVLDMALETGVRRFVFTSSIATLPISSRPGRLVDEGDGPHNWLDRGGDYVRSRVDAEALVLHYARERGLLAVALCVATTYGPGDFLPTPHGDLLKAAARGRLPFYVRGAGAEVVDVRDAARALVLAAERGTVGERYVVSERFMSTREVHDLAADVGGAPRPRWGIPLVVMSAAGLVGELVARLTRRDVRLTRTTVRLMHVMTPLDHGKAVRELGWTPRPVTESITDAAVFFTTRRPAATTGASGS